MAKPRFNFQEEFERQKKAGFNCQEELERQKEIEGDVRRREAERVRPRFGFQEPFSAAQQGSATAERPRADSAGGGGARDEASQEQGRNGASGHQAGGRESGSRESGSREWPPERSAGPADQMHYLMLGLAPEDATVERIKEAYRKAVLSNHPDKAPDDPFVLERFKAIQRAYEELMRERGVKA